MTRTQTALAMMMMTPVLIWVSPATCHQASATTLSHACVRISVLGLVAGIPEEEELICLAHQRRLRVAAAALLCLLPGDRADKRHPEFDWEEHVSRLTEDEFKARYRLSVQSFDKLLDIVRPELEVKNSKQAFFSRSGKPIPVEAYAR